MPTKQNKITKKQAIMVLAGWLVLCVASVFLVYFWRVAYEPAFISAVSLNLFTLLFLSIIYFCACASFIFLKDKYALKTALLIFLAGLVFVFVSGPLQPPDEHGHFFRAYAMSQGSFNFDANRVFDGDAAALMQSFTPAYMNGYNQSMAGCFEKYASLAATGTATPVSEAVNFQIIPYIPQAIFIFIARIFGFSALGQLYAARIGALLFYSVICYFALKNCDRYKPVMTAVMFLPISLYIASSCSYDGLLISGAYLLFSFFCKEQITSRDIPLLVVSCAVSAVKLPQLLMVLVILLIPKEHWAMKTKKNKSLSPWLVVGGIILATYVVYKGMEFYSAAMSNFDTISRWNPDVNINEQIKFMLSNPLRYLAVMFFSLYENGFYLNGLGSFGALDNNILLVVYISIISMLCGCFFCSYKQNKDRKTSMLAVVLLAVLYIGATITAMYVTWTPVAMVRVIGVQVRYFLPAIPFILASLAWLISKLFTIKEAALKKAETASIIIPFTAAVVSAILLFQHTYIGPFIRGGTIF